MPSIHNADQTIDHLDFQVSCCVKRAGGTGGICPQHAVAYIVYHRVGDCHRGGSDEFGNMTGNVCQHHLDQFQHIADTLLAPDSGQLQKMCGSCGKHLNELSDIVVRVEPL